VIFPATTDPGRRYLNRPINSSGTAIVKPGHYRGLWKKGPHGSRRIDAFRQNNPVTAFRDRDLDNYLDMAGVREETGVFWINLHPPPSGPGAPPRQIGPWSAGCQVPASWDAFADLRRLRDLQIRHTGADSFSCSLLTSQVI